MIALTTYRPRCANTLLPGVLIVVLCFFLAGCINNPSPQTTKAPAPAPEEPTSLYKALNPPKPEPWGFWKTMHHTMFVQPNQPRKANIMLGANDFYDYDRSNTRGSTIMVINGVWAKNGPYTEVTPPTKKSGIDYDFDTPNTDRLRARARRNRAKRELKANQKLAQYDRNKQKTREKTAKDKDESSGCFPEEMQVILADGTTRSIARIKPGDRVLTYDLGYEKTVGRPVVKRYSVMSNHLYAINQDLKTTGGERVLTPSGWTVLSEINPGDLIHINGGMAPVANLSYDRLDIQTYNLQVADTHNFYISTRSGDIYLVHNSGGGGAK